MLFWVDDARNRTHTYTHGAEGKGKGRGQQSQVREDLWENREIWEAAIGGETWAQPITRVPFSSSLPWAATGTSTQASLATARGGKVQLESRGVGFLLSGKDGGGSFLTWT